MKYAHTATAFQNKNEIKEPNTHNRKRTTKKKKKPSLSCELWKIISTPMSRQLTNWLSNGMCITIYIHAIAIENNTFVKHWKTYVSWILVDYWADISVEEMEIMRCRKQKENNEIDFIYFKINTNLHCVVDFILVYIIRLNILLLWPFTDPDSINKLTQ